MPCGWNVTALSTLRILRLLATLKHLGDGFMSIISDFKKFASRGNLIDLAIGFTVGAAFSTVAKSLVNDLIMPPVGLITGNTDFADKFIILRRGIEKAPPYATLKDAQEAGAVTLNYGQFINSVMALLVVAVAMFIIIRLVNSVEEKLEEEFGEEKPPEEPENKKCPHCRLTVPYRATRCGHCTSPLDEPPAAEAAT